MLNVTLRSGQFMVYRNGYATDNLWPDLTGFVDSVVTRVIDHRPYGLNNAFAQKRFVRRYRNNAEKQLAGIAVVHTASRERQFLLQRSWPAGAIRPQLWVSGEQRSPDTDESCMGR